MVVASRYELLSQLDREKLAMNPICSFKSVSLSHSEP